MPAQQKLTWSIVGLGSQAERIAETIQTSRNGMLWGVVSSDIARANDFSKKHGAIRAFDSLPELLRESPGGAVFICSPNHRHAQQCLLAIRSGHHVLCEKPMSLRASEAVAIREAVRKARIVFGVGYHLRHHPLFEKAASMVGDHVIGDLKLMELHWSIGNIGETKLPALTDRHRRWREDVMQSGGGALMARGVHLIDLSRFLSGNEVTDVTSLMNPALLRDEVDQTSLCLMRLRGGALVTIGTSRLVPLGMNRAVLYGSAGRIVLDQVFDPCGGGTLEWTNGRKTIRQKGALCDVYLREIEAFADRVRGGSSPGADVNDGLVCVSITAACRRSAITGRTVAL